MIYFAVGGRDRHENEAISDLQPQNILISFFHWKDRDIKKWCEKVGYRPKILLDSGAFSAWNKGKKVDINEYMDYIKENRQYINQYINLDVIGDAEASYKNYKKMKAAGLHPVPVHHYQTENPYLQEYVKENKLIALGGTVGIRNKRTVARWINKIIRQYPNNEFHLLGSTSKKILKGCPGLRSADSATWIIGAFNGRPAHKEGKAAKAKYNMKKALKLDRQPKTEQLSLF